jgi:transcriptional regulator with XRE-family HTH domain
MAGNKDMSAAMHFGRQMKKERLARGWSLQELSGRTAYDPAHLSRIENGVRPPTRTLAVACDAVFPERRGWFTEYYDESRQWAEVPPGFRDWAELEDQAAQLRAWSPGIIHGLLQTEDYARAVLSTWRRDTADEVEAKVAIRLGRQSVLASADFRVLLDESVLHRRIGAPEVMAMQLEHLLTIGARPNITIQVIPGAAGAYAGLTGAFAVAEVPGESPTAYLETGLQGITVRDPTLVSSAARMFDDLRDEALSRSRSLELIAEVVKP